MADEEMKKSWEELSLGYTESRGNPLLLAEIGKLYENDAVKTERNTIVCAPQEGVFLAMTALLEPGDVVVCMWPGYQSLYSVAESITGRAVSRWMPRLDEAGVPFSFAIDDLEELLEGLADGVSPKAIVTNCPHNPTGAMLTREDQLRLVAICERYDCFLFSDEMYRCLEAHPATTRLPAACDIYAKGISLSGVSKALSCPGLRIGWLVCRDEAFMDRCCELKDFTTICSSAPSEVLAIVVLRSREQILVRNRTLIEGNKVLLRQFMDKHKNLFAWHEPCAGTVCFPRLVSDNNDIASYTRDLVESHGLMLLPSSVYGYGEPCFRLGLGRANFAECLARWESAIEEGGD